MHTFTLCVRMYVCMFDVRHDMQIPCTRYLAINRLYLMYYNGNIAAYVCLYVSLNSAYISDNIPVL